ncbi:hypothetical protein [Lactococcus petauri]|uniref:hypothetical protein n=1 Tax=Lactococcus petauri TaxID=1940789 RepID=UPI001BCD9CC6|nr:hypothetical protein [Lactococcus petauri]MBS4460218.1 hypothetical protein [Lactococcus petauri]
MVELKDIEPVGVIVQDGNDHGLIESDVIQGISTLPVGTKIYTAEQIQEYAKSKVLEALKTYGIQESWWSEEETLKRYELVSEDLFKEKQDEEVCR